MGIFPYVHGFVNKAIFVNIEIPLDTPGVIPMLAGVRW